MVRRSDSRSRLALLTVLAMLALAALACGIGGAEPTAEPTQQPTELPTAEPTQAPTEAPTTAPTQAPADNTTGESGGSKSSGGDVGSGIVLDVVNNTSSTVCYLYLSPSTDTEWGNDQLGASDVIGSGQYFTLTDIAAGTYDLRADDCDGNILVQNFGIEMTSTEGYTWTLSDSQVTLTVVNNSSVDLCWLYVSPSTDDEWGPDQFGPETILRSGQSFAVEGIDPGTYDLRVEGCSGEELEEYGLDLSGDFEYTVTD